MSKLPYFPFYPSDFIADTQLLTDKEVGAYFRLLSAQWLNGAIPSQKIPLLIEDYDIVWPEIKHYFLVTHGKVTNKRLERERVKAIALIDVRSEAGKAGAKARWDGKGNAIANSKSNGKHDGKTMLTQNSEPISNNTKPITKKERVRFAPPSLDEVIELFISKGSNKIEAEKFFYHYEANGWMVGRNKMKSWQSAVSGWITRNKSNEIESTVISTLE